MIVGAIEVIENNNIAGWLYCEAIDLYRKEVLAFLGEECIGAGVVSIFRQDLIDAGLKGGYLGFSIVTNLIEYSDRANVKVALKDSNLYLLPEMNTELPR